MNGKCIQVCMILKYGFSRCLVTEPYQYGPNCWHSAQKAGIFHNAMNLTYPAITAGFKQKNLSPLESDNHTHEYHIAFIKIRNPSQNES